MAARFANRALRSGVVWAGVAGGAFAGLAYLASIALLGNPFLRAFAVYPGLFPSFAALSSFVVGGTCWLLLVERPRQPTRVRGAIVGLVTGLAVHPLTWALVLGYDSRQHGTTPFQPEILPFVLLFSIFSLGEVGVITVTIGVLGGIGVALLRARTIPWEREGERSLAVVVGSGLLTGVVTVTLLLLLSFVLPLLAAAALVAAILTIPVLRRLPAVGIVLAGAYPGTSGDVAPGSFDRSSLVRHSLALLGVGVGYSLAGFGYAVAVEFLLSALADALSLGPRWSSSGPFFVAMAAYPVLFVAGSLLIVCVTAYRWERGAGRPPRDVTMQWAAFLALVVSVYTAAFLAAFDALS